VILTTLSTVINVENERPEVMHFVDPAGLACVAENKSVHNFVRSVYTSQKTLALRLKRSYNERKIRLSIFLEDYIKRVIGLPGDEVRIEGGMVYVNGSLLDEPYIAAPPSYPGVWAVPEDSFFVLGDNRNQSSDSHSWGFVPLENIVGKALVVYWPLDQIKTLYHPLIVNAAN